MALLANPVNRKQSGSSFGLKMVLSWVLLAGLGQFAVGQTTYTYTGSTFTVADPPFTTADRVTGWFTVAVPLPLFMAETDISHLLIDYSFSDGEHTRTPANSDLCAFEVGVESEGHIFRWLLIIRQSGVAMGDPQQVIDSSQHGDQAGIGPAGANSCDNLNLSASANNSIGGVWSDSLPAGSPTTYTFTGALFTQVEPPYTTAQRLTGWFTIGNPLPQFATTFDISQYLDDFSFTDGIQTRHPGNTEICDFEVATNGAGDITDWRINLRETPFTNGNPQQTLHSSPFSDLVGSGPAGVFACDSIELSPSAESPTSGVWTDPLPPGVITDYTYDGAPFTDVLPPYTTAHRLTGFVRFGNPLPAYLTEKEMGFALENYSFFDGVQTLSARNSVVCSLRVTTDANGNIIKWRFSLRQTPFSQGQPQGFIDGSHFGDQGGNAPADADACGSIDGNAFGNNNVAGVWNDSILQPDPVVYLYLGATYQAAIPPYQIGKRLGGRIALPGLLPPNLPLTDISEHLLGFQFRDEIQTRSGFNSEVCLFEVSTDPMGEIVQWRFSLREPVEVMGLDQDTVFSESLGTLNGDSVGQGLAGAFICDSISLDISADTGSKGSWREFCPAQLAALSSWPEPLDLLDLLDLECQ